MNNFTFSPNSGENYKTQPCNLTKSIDDCRNYWCAANGRTDTGDELVPGRTDSATEEGITREACGRQVGAHRPQQRRMYATATVGSTGRIRYVHSSCSSTIFLLMAILCCTC